MAESARVELATANGEAKEKEAAAEEVQLDDIPLTTRLGEVGRAFLPMGFVAFGGPQVNNFDGTTVFDQCTSRFFRRRTSRSS